MQQDLILNSMFIALSLVFIIQEFKVSLNPMKYATNITAHKVALKAKDLNHPGLLQKIIYEFGYLIWTVLAFIFYSKLAALSMFVLGAFSKYKFHPTWLRIDAILSVILIAIQMVLAGIPVFKFLFGQ